MIHLMRWISLISSGHSIQMQKNTPSFQVHMEHSPESWVTYQTPVNLRKLNCIKHLLWPQHYETRYQLQEKKTVENTKAWRLNITFLNNEQVTEEIKREITKFLETNDNENTIQSLWDAAKAVLRGKFIAIQSFLNKQEKHQIYSLSLHLKVLEKEQQQKKIVKGKKSKRSKQK